MLNNTNNYLLYRLSEADQRRVSGGPFILVIFTLVFKSGALLGRLSPVVTAATVIGAAILLGSIGRILWDYMPRLLGIYLGIIGWLATVFIVMHWIVINIRS